MAYNRSKKTLTTTLNIRADEDYSCSVTKDYSNSFMIEQELDGIASADGLYTLTTVSKTVGSLTIATAKAVLIKNISNVAAEIAITTYAWKNSSSVDITNDLALAGGDATRLRTLTLILPAGDFFYLNTNRLIAYDPVVDTTLESGAYAPVGLIAIEPKDINSANEYKGVQEIDGTTYGEGTEILNNGALSSLTDTSLVVDDGSWFKADDTIFFGTEVARVRSVSSNTLTIERALFGSTAIALSNDEPMNYFFGNHYLPFDTGKCQSDASGRFKQAGAFFGHARTTDRIADGLVSGSVAIQIGYSVGGYLDWGLSGITANTETGLLASTAYTFHIVVDEFNTGGIDSLSSSPDAEVAIAFTTDASDTTFSGSANAVLPKIQAVFDEQFYTTSSGLRNKKVSIGLHNGDVRVKSHSNHSDTIVGIANVSGTSPFGVGSFPALTGDSVPDLLGSEHGGGSTDDIVYGTASRLPPATIDDKATGVSETNKSAFIFDDGNGNLKYLGRNVGSIDYEKGHCEWHIPSLPNAEFKIYGQSHSAHSGGTSNILNGYNTIRSIKGRSMNPIAKTKLQLLLFG